MEAIANFTLAKHDGPYESWPLATEVFRDGVATGRKLPGFVLDAQYEHGGFYLFVTSWDCPFEESLEVVLTDSDLRIVDRKSIGVMYSSTWLEACEVVSANQLRLQCDSDRVFRVTVQSGRLSLKRLHAGADSTASLLRAGARRATATPWWRFW
ncbi:hypothetical protein [uncultured Thiodictyon sp.]|uniref:hypothetical protein n=1 Tax=uncultured Thiodictyon sp. TaxID=1846217 RepID=UPI0025D66E73|nr:hypothetical protein [uncultured Thiodictyon sp.]